MGKRGDVYKTSSWSWVPGFWYVFTITCSILSCIIGYDVDIINA